ncbi:hypothetical protein [Moorena sp. SIO3E8]|uniref:hypothetical protein n=1 Tax=Moorena sp. SIO3E8 TaxID=2607830 RepID=UPI0013FFF649|nr:hypothetical protein [Moorena sp. SIO3E8]NEO12775.1 hypothetical protein [Moorena sp. SIO3E8]NEO44783.1 hypothetical protein [Moorena sp. SIO4A3]NEP99550.1 hypothetical protein [Moorena sp. SIO3F7]
MAGLGLVRGLGDRSDAVVWNLPDSVTYLNGVVCPVSLRSHSGSLRASHSFSLLYL